MGLKDRFGKLFGFSTNESPEEENQKEEESSAEQMHSGEDEPSLIESSLQEEQLQADIEPAIVEELSESVGEVDESGEAEKNADNKPEQTDVNLSQTEIFEDDSVKTEEINEESDEKPEKKGFFAKLKIGLEKTRHSINDKLDTVLKAFKKVDEELYDELEEALIMADVGVETSLYIIAELRKKVKENKITESEQVKGAIEEIIAELLCDKDNVLNLSTVPSVIMVIGVNGVGKTTSIGKMAARFKAEGKNVILGAADTFRAAAIDQLQIWAERSDIELIKHQEGSDPASVVFDTISAAKARKSDVIILDTAGRLHNKKNLMDELSKINRVIQRELPETAAETLLVLDATTGQNAVNQAKLFSETADITGIILTKLDGSAKGGIVLAIAHEQNIPVKLVGVGEGIGDLQDFVPEDFAQALFSE